MRRGHSRRFWRGGSPWRSRSRGAPTVFRHGAQLRIYFTNVEIRLEIITQKYARASSLNNASRMTKVTCKRGFRARDSATIQTRVFNHDSFAVVEAAAAGEPFLNDDPPPRGSSPSVACPERTTSEVVPSSRFYDGASHSASIT